MIFSVKAFSQMVRIFEVNYLEKYYGDVNMKLAITEHMEINDYYMAISHVWGDTDGSNSGQFFCRNVSSKAKASALLSQILQYSRLPVWIDLISIGTDDNIKAKQVAVMDLVYSNAAAALVLLEPEDAIRIIKATEVCKKWYNACLGRDTQENIKEMIKYTEEFIEE